MWLAGLGINHNSTGFWGDFRTFLCNIFSLPEWSHLIRRPLREPELNFHGSDSI